MKGYAFIDADCNLQYRTQKYIEEDNPYFWQQNRHYIMYKWWFDTDDLSRMYFVFRQIREIFTKMNLSPRPVEEFCSMINFDTKLLKDVNKV